jgi:hypothetical protein
VYLILHLVPFHNTKAKYLSQLPMGGLDSANVANSPCSKTDGD